jgi:FixJ family two-component response regulator
MAASAFTVFLIDDDPGVLRSLDRLLQAAGYETKPYQSAEAFLNEHDASIPGCAVLDHAMPGLSGLDLQEALARQGIHRPVIFLTGQGTIPESVKAMRAGAVDYLTKPVDNVEAPQPFAVMHVGRPRTAKRLPPSGSSIIASAMS